jgi:RimJ/RimL family protein N-acetyltransferase
MTNIRRLRPTDAQDLYESVCDSLGDLIPWMPWCHPNYTRGEAETWLAEQVKAFDAGTAFEFAITGDDDRLIGAIGLNGITKGSHRANLGYWVRTSMCGRGIATDAVQLLYDWALVNTELHRIEIQVAMGNAPSQRVAEKAGAAREGVLRARLILHDTAHDAVMFSLTR